MTSIHGARSATGRSRRPLGWLPWLALAILVLLIALVVVVVRNVQDDDGDLPVSDPAPALAVASAA